MAFPCHIRRVTNSTSSNTNRNVWPPPNWEMHGFICAPGKMTKWPWVTLELQLPSASWEARCKMSACDLLEIGHENWRIGTGESALERAKRLLLSKVFIGRMKVSSQRRERKKLWFLSSLKSGTNGHFPPNFPPLANGQWLCLEHGSLQTPTLPDTECGIPVSLQLTFLTLCILTKKGNWGEKNFGNFGNFFLKELVTTKGSKLLGP